MLETDGTHNRLAEKLGDQHATVQRALVARLADPYLTDHDRWVLCQFATFLSGIAPHARRQRRADGPRGPQLALPLDRAV